MQNSIKKKRWLAFFMAVLLAVTTVNTEGLVLYAQTTAAEEEPTETAEEEVVEPDAEEQTAQAEEEQAEPVEEMLQPDDAAEVLTAESENENRNTYTGYLETWGEDSVCLTLIRNTKAQDF